MYKQFFSGLASAYVPYTYEYLEEGRPRPVVAPRFYYYPERSFPTRMDFAPYLLFDELYGNFDSFAKVVQSKGLTARLLGLTSAYEAQNNIVEILSPLNLDSLPCILVDVTLLPGSFKRALAVDGGLNRLVQFIGSLSLLPDNKKTWCLRALTYTFMDGVDLRSYEEAVRITRPYVKIIDF